MHGYGYAWIRGNWIEQVVHAADDGCEVARAISMSPWRPWLKRRWERHEHGLTELCNFQHVDPEHGLQLARGAAVVETI